MFKLKNKGFTLIELLVVIAVISLLASIAIVSLNTARVKARDIKRVAELKQLEKALYVYYTDKGQFPGNDDPGDPECWGLWESGNLKVPGGDTDPFIPALGIITPKEWTDIKDGWNSRCTYRYARWPNPCNGCCTGTYAILYAACEGNNCPVNEKPSCCADACGWGEGAGSFDARDYVIFLKE